MTVFDLSYLDATERLRTVIERLRTPRDATRTVFERIGTGW